MQTEIASSAARRSINSPTRAQQIIEQVSAKHRIAVPRLVCAAWKRDVILARGEIATRLQSELNWSQRRIATALGCSPARACSLLREHKLREAQARLLLPAADVAALAAVTSDARLARALEAEERAAYAEAELARLAGYNLALRYAEALGMMNRMRCAIVLAIVAEAYPRLVLGAELIEHYDEACIKLGYGEQKGANFNLLTKNVSHLRDHFQENGWPVPINVGDAYTPKELTGARRLTDEAAAFLHERLAAPRASQIEASRDLRSARVPAVARR